MTDKNMGLDIDKIADDLGLPRDKFRAGVQRIQLEQKAVPVPWQDVVAAIKAVGDESWERGRMYPQDSDEHSEDRAAERRICGMIEWYANNGGSVAERLPAWPRYLAFPPATPSAAGGNTPYDEGPFTVATPSAVPALLTEVHLISEAYDRIRAERTFAADDLEYDLFAAGWKECARLSAAPAPAGEKKCTCTGCSGQQCDCENCCGRACADEPAGENGEQ